MSVSLHKARHRTSREDSAVPDLRAALEDALAEAEVSEDVRNGAGVDVRRITRTPGVLTLTKAEIASLDPGFLSFFLVSHNLELSVSDG